MYICCKRNPFSPSFQPPRSSSFLTSSGGFKKGFAVAEELIFRRMAPVPSSSSDMRDLLTEFSPSLDYFAITAGDGRIKIWDTLKGHLQTEFADIVATSVDASVFGKTTERGHLSVDYTCMKWLSLDRKKKRKLGSSFLVLGTGSGDVLALDVSAGQLKWSVSNCHPGGVSAISFSSPESCIYTAGADGMICKVDPHTGNMLGKFRASRKAISCMSVSPDGRILATGTAQLKLFSCADQKKIKKISGHPGTVRSMIFSEDGKYILSSGVGEKYIALWRADGEKQQSASCVLALEHPPVFLNCKCIGDQGMDSSGLYVVSISEVGVCYTWCGQNIEELKNCNPTKVSLSSVESFSNSNRGALPTIFAAKVQGTAKPTAAHLFIAHGLLVKPLFQKILVQSGMDVTLSSSLDGGLLLHSQAVIRSKKGTDVQHRVTALDRANLENALLPIPKVSDLHESKVKGSDHNDGMAHLVSNRSHQLMDNSDGMQDVGTVKTSIEKQLMQSKILSNKDDTFSSEFNFATSMGVDLGANIPRRKMRALVLAMEPSKAYKLLEVLVATWQSRSSIGKFVLPWIYNILVWHGHYIMSQENPESQTLSSLLKITKARGVAVQSLLQLSGRLQLVTAQIDKAALNKTPTLETNDQMDDSEDDEVDERPYGGEDDESQLSSAEDS